MTDNEIIGIMKNCSDCICYEDCAYKRYGIYCREHLMENAIDIINRQQTEIERLKKEKERLSENVIAVMNSAENHYSELFDEAEEIVRAEAIMDFAEMLGNYKEYRYNENCDFVPYVKLSDIEKVVYEMVGAEE